MIESPSIREYDDPTRACSLWAKDLSRRPAKHSAPSSCSYNLNVESESDSSDSEYDLRVKD